MKNSEKINLCLKNKNNPLRKDYLKDYKTIVESTGNNYWIINAVLFFIFAALYIGGWIYFANFFRYVVIVLGLINLIIGHILFMRSDGDSNKLQTAEFREKIENLNDKYAKRGYIHDDIDSLYSCSGKCGEYDDCREQFVCSVDFMPLTYEKRKWCQTEGNCVKCEKLKNKLFSD